MNRTFRLIALMLAPAMLLAACSSTSEPDTYASNGGAVASAGHAASDNSDVLIAGAAGYALARATQPASNPVTVIEHRTYRSPTYVRPASASRAPSAFASRPSTSWRSSPSTYRSSSFSSPSTYRYRR